MIALVTALALANTQPCALPHGWREIEARHTRYIVFGEIHGTAQSPAMIGDVACALAAKGEHLLVAVELSDDQNTALQAAWAGPDPDFAAAMDRTMEDWKSRRDGVASVAMHTLLARLHALKAVGAAIDIVAFNADATPAQFKDLPGQGPHEAGQAANIQRAAASRAHDHVLVLVGNLHAEKIVVERGGARFLPMAMQLAPANEITSLSMEFSSGTMWNCGLKPGFVLPKDGRLPKDAIDCGAHPVRSGTNVAGGSRLGMGSLPASGEPAGAYDGYYWVGTVEGSGPYFESRKP